MDQEAKCQIDFPTQYSRVTYSGTKESGLPKNSNHEVNARNINVFSSFVHCVTQHTNEGNCIGFVMLSAFEGMNHLCASTRSSLLDSFPQFLILGQNKVTRSPKRLSIKFCFENVS
ncbi:hypothetical protein CEXT_741591 [Caerostris extrusa]|uniref:Uncharacterized protein n=1 Tax=Caerostris extrusa TaxID=172846 RepID=A0AAV4Q645_CAEEX|nr:hypothetical protein CEXT_741591 [Caerostris extrusa]